MLLISNQLEIPAYYIAESFIMTLAQVTKCQITLFGLLISNADRLMYYFIKRVIYLGYHTAHVASVRWQ